MDQSNSNRGSASTDDGITSHSMDESLDDVTLDSLPQGVMLSSDHGREKAAVMRRNVAGRKKPTRQGLRDSLLKSMDESELQSILAEVSIEEEDENDRSCETDARVDRTSSAAVRTNSSRNPLMASLNNDLTNVLKRRESKKTGSGSAEVKSSRNDTATKHVAMPTPADSCDKATKIPVNIEEKSDPLKLPPIDRTSKPKMSHSVPDVIPQRRMPDLTIRSSSSNSTTQMERTNNSNSTTQMERTNNFNSTTQMERTNNSNSTTQMERTNNSNSTTQMERTNNSNSTTQMETSSPEYKPQPTPFIKPRLRPVSLHRRPSKETEEQAVPWANKLNRISAAIPKDKQLSSGGEPYRVPWSPKLRKVDIPSNNTIDSDEADTPPVLPPRPKLRPVLASQNYVTEQKENRPDTLVMQQQSVSLATLPTKTLQSPVSNHPKYNQPQPKEKEPDTIIDENKNHWEHPRRPVPESVKLRKPHATTISQPDWIRQAAEKRKRASILIEQAEVLANLSKNDEPEKSPISDQMTDPFVQLRHPKKTSRSSSIDSNSTTSSHHSEVTVPAWKRQLNHQNSQRRIDRRKKTQSAIEPSITSFDDGKENREDNSTPAWKREMKNFSRASVIEIKENEPSGAEPEFIKLFKKRQERLRKSGSSIVETE